MGRVGDPPQGSRLRDVPVPCFPLNRIVGSSPAGVAGLLGLDQFDLVAFRGVDEGEPAAVVFVGGAVGVFHCTGPS